MMVANANLTVTGCPAGFILIGNRFIIAPKGQHRQQVLALIIREALELMPEVQRPDGVDDADVLSAILVDFLERNGPVARFVAGKER